MKPHTTLYLLFVGIALPQFCLAQDVHFTQFEKNNALPDFYIKAQEELEMGNRTGANKIIKQAFDNVKAEHAGFKDYKVGLLFVGTLFLKMFSSTPLS